MKASAACASLLSGQAVAEAAWGSGDAHVQSTAMRQPRPQAFGARGAPNLTLGFATKPSPSAPWPGGYCRRSGNGGPQTCLPAAHSVAKQQAVQPIFISKTPKTLARRMMQDLLWSSLARQAHEERRYQGGANLTRLS